MVFNSSPAVASAIEGVPVFITDPIPERSQASLVANTDLSCIESPKTPERLGWVQQISMSHWNFEDLRNGVAWNYMRDYI